MSTPATKKDHPMTAASSPRLTVRVDLTPWFRRHVLALLVAVLSVLTLLFGDRPAAGVAFYTLAAAGLHFVFPTERRKGDQ